MPNVPPTTRRSLSNLLRLPCAVGLILWAAGTVVSAESEKISDILELRSYTRIGGTFEFSVYNKNEKRSRWLAVNEQEDGYTIKSYDSERNEIVIQFNGREGRLPLQASQIHEYAPEPPAPPPQANPSAQATTPRIPEIPLPPKNSPGRRRGPAAERGTDRSGGDNSLQTPDASIPGGFAGGRSSRNPGSPSPDPDSPDGENPDDGGEPDQNPWDSIGEPPPIPRSAPPSYEGRLQ